MDSRELSEWQAYYHVEGYGELMAWLRMGIVCHQIDRWNRVRGTPDPPLAFIPFAPQAIRRRSQSMQQQKVIMDRAMAGFARFDALNRQRRGGA